MEITHQLNEKDFVEAYYVNRKRNPFAKWSNRIALWAALLVAVSSVSGLILLHGLRITRDYLPLACLTLVWIVVLEAWPRWAMKQQFRKQPGAHGPRSVIFDADGVHWRWNGGSSDVAWKNYIRWVEGEHQILFYTSPACFSILPTRELQPAQVAELRELLKRNIQPPSNITAS